MPSRIRNLFTECLELIPTGMFRAIGDILIKNCAHVRDSAIETMVETAQACSSGGSKEGAVKVVRNCMNILELMKLVRHSTDVYEHNL